MSYKMLMLDTPKFRLGIFNAKTSQRRQDGFLSIVFAQRCTPGRKKSKGDEREEDCLRKLARRYRNANYNYSLDDRHAKASSERTRPEMSEGALTPSLVGQSHSLGTLTSWLVTWLLAARRSCPGFGLPVVRFLHEFA